jgi:hypothetical protein
MCGARARFDATTIEQLQAALGSIPARYYSANVAINPTSPMMQMYLTMRNYEPPDGVVTSPEKNYNHSKRLRCSIPGKTIIKRE